MALFNCKVKLRFKWKNNSVLSVVGAYNADANSNNIFFTNKNTKLFVPAVTLLAKDNQKRLSKEF